MHHSNPIEKNECSFYQTFDTIDVLSGLVKEEVIN